ncbi:thiamine-phosphate kinase [uncultured Maricaulis sp.]|uniref:thiamine-phosphate kinase n=1 Tax=uncultured Maricaulis sp. TaxID=174710 RepID=UPI0030D88897|tara:strand:+ start:555 stop:1520 length:966 start_codon:yes stop_codon:yes gene_type:complete
MAGGGEFGFIRTRLAPLAGGHPAALDLTDDAAVLDPEPGHQLVIASDMLVAGVHFLETDAPEIAAERCVRSNLSDLAAMGAQPLGYLSSIAWPAGVSERWRDGLVAGLAKAQNAFGLCLLGGDTTVGPGPLTISLTMLGQVPSGTALLRRGAEAGDDVWVSGTIGDARLGLDIARGILAADPALLERYHRPTPRLALGQRLRGLASACLDISDGLIADAGHIAELNGVRIELQSSQIPLSPSAVAAVKAGQIDLAGLVTGGDDYELFFCAPASRREIVHGLAASLGLPLTRIGAVITGQGVALLDSEGGAIETGSGGFTHF